jgi:polyhydroxybutyrate depolymerase
MQLKPIITIALITLIVVSQSHAQRSARRWQGGVTGVRNSVEHEGRERHYRIHVPQQIREDQPVPLVLFLHGGGGTADVASRMGMTTVADRHGFIVVYPEAIDKHWNDGRDSQLFREHDERINDVAYLTSLVDTIGEARRIDRGRIFVAGVSNGGFMSQRLAIEESQLFAAAGILIATMGEPLSREFAPEHPVSVLFMNGTEDPLVPYDGGEVGNNLPRRRVSSSTKPSRGNCIATDDAVQLWLDRNGLDNTQPTVATLDDNEHDGSQVEVSLWSGGESNTSVALYRVVNGGHTIPGGAQYLPARLVGKRNEDIDGLETVWQFFATRARR